MQTVNLYSSVPLSTLLACAVQGLSRQGTEVVVRPLSELVASPTRKQLRLQDEHNAVRLQLATVGELLDSVEMEAWCSAPARSKVYVPTAIACARACGA